MFFRRHQTREQPSEKAPARYRNPRHKPGKPEYGPEFYETTAKPDKYKGYLIYHRVRSTSAVADGTHVYDIVKDGVCVTQMAGPNGARGVIDELVGG
jgi:hypothetical protein